MKKLFFILFTCLFLAACQEVSEATSEKEVHPENEWPRDPISGPEMESDEEGNFTDPTPVPDFSESDLEQRDPATGMPLALMEAVKQSLPGWKVLSPKKWLAPEYIQSYNENAGQSEQITFDDLFAQANFNGDGFLDYAVYVEDGATNVKLVVLHGSDQGYVPVELEAAGQLPECCLGMGLRVAQAGVHWVYGDEGEKEQWQLHNDGFFEIIYEKAASLYAMDISGEYVSRVMRD